MLAAAFDVGERLKRGFEPHPAGFPPGPRGDVAVELLRNPLAFLEDAAARHGGAVALVLGGERVVLVSDPGLAQAVLIDQAADFVKEGTAFFPGTALAGQGLLVSDGDTWRRQRQLANPAFRRSAVASYAAAMAGETRSLLEGPWAGGGARPVYADFNTLTLDITTAALFGTGLPRDQATEVTGAIRTAFEFFSERAASGFVVPEWLPTPGNAAYAAAVTRLDAAVYGVIDRRAAELAAAPAQAPQSLLDALLGARDEGGGRMARRALRNELMTLLVAGQETAAIALAWACALLAHHPAAQARAAAEVEAQLGGERPSAANAGSLRYLEAVVLEALRLRPPAYLVGRCAARDVNLGPYSLPAGTTVLVSPYLLHRDAARWQAPAAFRPERWAGVLAQRGGAAAALHGLGPNGAYVPFGAGPRNCIGTGFAMLEAVVVLASMLQRFRLSPLPGAAFPAAEPRITLRPSAVELIVDPR
ncbi:hypothetical protein WJX81_007701 [Elliptochloris bilobata]|uniref:Cytochrome P450 n=1 Tax=Elliptochloris bilobata TaxID=381761 RepID=A0AAW1S9N3_9CHLO